MHVGQDQMVQIAHGIVCCVLHKWHLGLCRVLLLRDWSECQFAKLFFGAKAETHWTIGVLLGLQVACRDSDTPVQVSPSG